MSNTPKKNNPTKRTKRKTPIQELRSEFKKYREDSITALDMMRRNMEVLAGRITALEKAENKKLYHRRNTSRTKQKN